MRPAQGRNDAPSYNRSGGTRAVAQELAIGTGRRILVVVGLLDGPDGMPASVGVRREAIRLRSLGEYTRTLSTGMFEIVDEDRLCQVVDRLQEIGNYRATVVNVDGTVDPAYTI